MSKQVLPRQPPPSRRLDRLDRQGLHARVYERPAPDGKGRQVVKESIVPRHPENAIRYLPDFSRLFLRNEAEAIRYVKEHTTIPVPNIVEVIDEPGSPFQIVMEYVENARCPLDLQTPRDYTAHLVSKLEGYVSQLHAISDPECRSFAGLPLFTCRLEYTGIPIQTFSYRRYPTESPYVLCHGDLAWHNILVDCDTLEIVCVLDWEYAGFYPVEVESEYWRRAGKIWADRGEWCDIDRVMDVLWSHRDHLEQTRRAAEEKSGSTGSQLRELLRHAHIPSDQTPSIGGILGQSVHNSRQSIADGLRQISQTLTVDNLCTSSLVSNIDNSTSHRPNGKLAHMGEEHRAISNSSAALPKAFTALADQSDGVGAKFFPLREHFSAEAHVQEQLYATEKLKALIGTDDEKEESELRARSREMRMERRDIADQAYRDSEVQKWRSIKEFATTLLRLSTAAESLIPYLADHDREQPPRQIDPERAFAEYRANEVNLKGGSGGWVIKVENDEELVQEMKKAHLKDWESKQEARAKWLRFKEQSRDAGRRELEEEDRLRMVERKKLRSEMEAERGEVLLA